MAGMREIRGQIRAIQNTAKITKAMELVAASKMRKAQDRVLAARPYAEAIRRVIGNIVQAHPEHRHPYLVERGEVKRRGLVLVSTDRGLCGALNVNAFRAALRFIREGKEKGVETVGYAIGRRAATFLNKTVPQVAAVKEPVADAVDVTELAGVVHSAAQSFTSGELDEVWLLYSEFVNTMTQRPQLMRLLPCPEVAENEHPGYWDYLYEPEAAQVLDGLLNRYLESLVYHGVIENKASEYSARMVAMKNATDNANKLVRELTITYNKARQATITKELAEIVAGAEAAKQ